MIIPEAYLEVAEASDAEEELPSLVLVLSTLFSSLADSPAVESVFSASPDSDFSCSSVAGDSVAGAAASVAAEASFFSGCCAHANALPAISIKAAIVTIVFFIALNDLRFHFISSGS